MAAPISKVEPLLTTDEQSHDERNAKKQNVDQQPMAKAVRVPVPLKVQVIGDHVRIQSKPKSDGSRQVDMLIPISFVKMKLRSDDRIVYFEGHVRSTVGSLEIGERITKPQAW